MIRKGMGDRETKEKRQSKMTAIIKVIIECGCHLVDKFNILVNQPTSMSAKGASFL